MPLYLQEPSRDLLDCFNSNKALELPNLGGIKHLININRLIPYSLLYNLLKV